MDYRPGLGGLEDKHLKTDQELFTPLQWKWQIRMSTNKILQNTHQQYQSVKIREDIWHQGIKQSLAT